MPLTPAVSVEVLISFRFQQPKLAGSHISEAPRVQAKVAGKEKKRKNSRQQQAASSAARHLSHTCCTNCSLVQHCLLSSPNTPAQPEITTLTAANSVVQLPASLKNWSSSSVSALTSCCASPVSGISCQLMAAHPGNPSKIITDPLSESFSSVY